MARSSTIWMLAASLPVAVAWGCSQPFGAGFPTTSAVWAETLARFDRDGDPTISREEYAWFAENTPEKAGEFDAVNTDGGPGIDAAELGAFLANRRYREDRDLHVDGRARRAAKPHTPGSSGGWQAALAAVHPRKPSRAGPPNIVFISMDTTRADRLSAYGYARDTTPNIDKLAARGAIFESGFNPSNESIFSHTALLAGRYASEVEVFDYRDYVIPANAELVQEVLQNYGYETAAFVAGGHVSADFGTDQGWDTFHSEPGFSTFWSTAPRALRWLDERDGTKPWLVFLHGYDAHRPWSTPGPFHHLYGGPQPSPLAEMLSLKAGQSDRLFDHMWYPDLQATQFRHPGGTFILSPASYRVAAAYSAQNHKGVAVSDADLDHIQAHYDASLATMDLQLGLFFALAGGAGYLDNTLIILVSDHGEDMMDHGFLNHRTGLYDSCVHVPVILAGAGVPAGRREGGLVDAFDVAATVLDAADAMPPAGMRGTSLLERLAGGVPPTETLYFEGVMDMLAARTSTQKLIANDVHIADPAMIDTLAGWPINDEHFELYDLVADPREQHNVLHTPDHASPPAAALKTAEALRTQLVAWRRSLHAPVAHAPSAQPSAEAIQQMRLHGYWEMDDAADNPAVTPAAAVPAGAPKP